jgi:ATP-dependent helicase/nuclease subunit A
MMTNAPGHRVIAASAGSGKTFQLANRYIALLASGIDPAQIVALTFSRKAAGEILDKILDRLAHSARSEDSAEELCGQLHQAGYSVAAKGLDRNRILGLLRILIDQLHLARIGTLDSFFVAILRAFPFEFGLGGPFEIMDLHSGSKAVGETLDRIFRTSDQQELANLLELFKLATFGQEAKGFANTLTQFIKEYHKLLLDAPDISVWGAPDRIWGCDPGYPVLDRRTRLLEIQTLRKNLDKIDLSPKQRGRFDRFSEEVIEFEPGTPISKPINDILSRFLPALEQLATHGTTVTMDSRKPLEIPSSTGQPLSALIRHIVGAELTALITRTRGIAHLLAQYERVYSRTVRGAGRLTFQDVQFLLGQGERGQGPVLSGQPGPDQVYIDYRLDGSFHHWLLDEFQDTSTVQWQALQNLANEVLQHRDGSRSLFYVGDVKQAIYGWRGGDSELFHTVLDTANMDSPVIQVDELATSWRSSPAVIQTVNQVFGHLREAKIPETTLSLWDRAWQSHKAQNGDLPGCTRLYCIQRDRKADANNLARLETLYHLIEEVQPYSRGLSAAVLVRSNKWGRMAVEFLRARNIPVSWEGDFTLVDSPAVRAFLAYLQYALHPSDTFARRHLEMTPVKALGPWHNKVLRPATMTVLSQLAQSGFELAVEEYTKQMIVAGALSTFDLHRLEQLRFAARQFDCTGDKSALNFCDFVKAYTVGEPAFPKAIQIMSIHKSKGLEFDAVFLPDLESKSGIDVAEVSGIKVSKAHDISRKAEWALLMPRKEITRTDPALARFHEQAVTEACYEELCVLYVAMTRPRYGLYMITLGQAKSGSSSLYLSTVLHRTLTGICEPTPLALEHGTGELLYSHGKPDWWKGLTPEQSPVVPESAMTPLPADKEAPTPMRVRLQRRTPSGEQTHKQPAVSFFASGSISARDLGTAVHLLFEEVEWADSIDQPAVVAAARQRASFTDSLWENAELQLEGSLASPEVITALTRPKTAAQLWREQPFEAIVDMRWTSGTFDRVVIRQDEQGNPQSATIQDFKTSRLDDGDALARELDKYRPQMLLYREVLSLLIGLSKKNITMELIFTRTGQVEEIVER